MTDRDNLIAYIWDAWKEIHGVRPRWLGLESMTMAQLEDEADRVTHALEIHNWREEDWTKVDLGKVPANTALAEALAATR